VRQRPVRRVQPLADRDEHPRGERPRRGERDLLAEHRADRQLSPVDRPRHPQPRPRRDERAEPRVAREVGVGRRRGLSRAVHRPRRRIVEADHPRAGDHTAIHAFGGHLLEARDRPPRQEVD